MKKKEIFNYYSKLAKKRLAKMTKKQMSEHGKMMARARWNKHETI